VEILATASGGVESLDAINPVWLKTPAAPRACELLGEPAADIPGALAAVRGLAARHTQVFCEGAGGWLVPVAANCTIADFAVELAWPVIVVVRNKLGALNHALLTLESIRNRDLPLAGIILNDLEGQMDEATRTNRRVLEESCGCPILAEVGRGQTLLPAAIL
jgi:dethiobiotin synthetase